MANSTTQKGISIHLGLNAVDPAGYNGWSGNLNACEQDAKDMAAIAQSRGFAQGGLLLTAKATVENFQNAFAEAAAVLDAGDTLFLSYSGHGGQVPDSNGDEPDGMDETWCMYDREMVDDELYAMFGTLAADVRVVMLSDSCHSGTVARAAMVTHMAAHPEFRPAESRAGTSFRPKLLPREQALEIYQKHRQFYDYIQKRTRGAEKAEIGAAVLLISGCQDEQTSLDGDRNGLFTENLLKVWNNGAFKGTYRGFRTKIVSKMPPYQTPNLFLAGTGASKFARAHPFTL